MQRRSFHSVAAFAAASTMLGAMASAIVIPTVPIGNPGNAADSTGFGSVAYTYNIGSTEVTNAQYAAFLNAKAASDPFSLYGMNFAGSFSGITRSGLPGSYTYSTVSGRADNPVNFVSFWDATRFANWLHNGQGSGDTETGAYTLDGVTGLTHPVHATITRNAGWQWAVTSEDEWYKAAYHQPANQGGDSDGYWLFPTSSNAAPTASQANFGSVDTVPVGSYAPNYYGTSDMGGNMWEWNESIFNGTSRGLRGGSFDGGGPDSMFSFNQLSDVSSNKDLQYGFRVVHIPGPSSVALLGLSGLLASRRRRS